MQHLNCAKGQAFTDSAIEEANTSRDIIILLLQEPCTRPDRQPPSSPLYNTFTPTPLFLKCVTYIRKNLNLSPRNIVPYDNNTLKITITINQQAIDIYNVYSPAVPKYIANSIKKFHPGPNEYIAGDLNAHHVWWYGDQANLHSNQIRNDKNPSTGHRRLAQH